MKSQKTLFKINILDIPDEYEGDILYEMFKIFDHKDVDELIFCEKNNGWESIYCLNNSENQEKLIGLFKKCDVLIDYQDLTDLVKNGHFNLVEKTPEFEKAFDYFIKENLNLDYVLDKVALQGEGSLTEEEREFLKNY
jgi:hypothetical protein